ncbi:hypothetical protein TWF191_001537 [Orbilia oligospora]|uniref:NB-ARC domain-containing protein n=1 Tax=Orbilia oligospora TaxID=2813651 RepID=A0A7C8U9L8_ORBOL|nr:hypothetical protein TWF191_001537 [Orbilia oligospora]
MATKLQKSRNDYTVGWICAIPIEIEAARKILDGIHPKPKVPSDDENCYEFGEINGHNVVISWLPRTKYGTTNAALVANCMRKTFKRLRFGLMIGVGGGAPSPFNDIRLGDIVVSQPTDRSGGVIQYDFGKAMEKGEFKMIGSLNAPPRILLSGVAAMAAIDPIKLGRRIFDVAWDIEKEDEERGGRFSYPGEDTDKLFRGNYLHVPACEDETEIHVGGMGKTQIAIEYAYRHHGSYYTAVLWVSAANEETIRASFINIMEHIIEEQARITWPESTPDYEMISRKLGIAGLVNSRGEIIVDSEIIINDIQKALFHWLQLSKNSKWLLIIDNADDLENFDIQKYIPNHGSGDIFVTSRRPEFSHVAEQANLEQLDKDSAINLLSSLAHITVPRKDVEHELVAVVTKLGFMPLAISHAGYFMQQTKVSPGEYLLHYEEAFMDAQARIPRFGWNYRRDKASTTWEMSFSRVEKENTEAAFLLLMCSYLNYEEISEDLWDTERFNRAQFREMVGLLSSYSLVRVVGTGIFSVHPVVHSWARERQAQPERLAVLKDVLILLGNASGRDKMSRESSNWDSREERMILAHLGYLDQHFDPSAFESFFHQEETKTGVETTAENKNLVIAFYNIAAVYNNGGKYGKALQWLGEYDEAVLWYERAIASSEEFFGKNHPTTLSTVSALASVYYNQKKYSMAIQLYKQVLDNKERVLGEDHPSTLETINNLALAYQHQGSYDVAVQLFQKALIGKEKCWGEHHLSTIETVNSLSWAYQCQGSYDVAIQLSQKALTRGEKYLGEDHPSTLAAIYNISWIYTQQNRDDEAIQWARRALTGYEKVSGTHHPQKVALTNNIASLYCRQGKFKNGLLWCKRALVCKGKTLGGSKLFVQDYLQMFDLVHAIASMHRELNQCNEAIKWYKRALIGKAKALANRTASGKDYQSTLDGVHHILEQIASIYKHHGKYDKAIQWYKRELFSRRRIFGRIHPSTVNAIRDIASVYKKKGMRNKAMRWYKRYKRLAMVEGGGGFGRTLPSNVVEISVNRPKKRTKPSP